MTPHRLPVAAMDEDGETNNAAPPPPPPHGSPGLAPDDKLRHHKQLQDRQPRPLPSPPSTMQPANPHPPEQQQHHHHHQQSQQHPQPPHQQQHPQLQQSQQQQYYAAPNGTQQLPSPDYRSSPSGSASMSLPSIQHFEGANLQSQLQYMPNPHINGAPPPMMHAPPPYNPYQPMPPTMPSNAPNGHNGMPRYALPPQAHMDARLMSGGRSKKEVKRRTKTGCLTCRKRRIKVCGYYNILSARACLESSVRRCARVEAVNCRATRLLASEDLKRSEKLTAPEPTRLCGS